MSLVFLLGFLGYENVLAKDYDLYVDAEADGSFDGSEDDPYKTISKAIEMASEEDEIYISEGEYNEDLVINKELLFFGEDLEDVVIDGQLEISKNVEAKDFTIDGNVVVKSGADIVFDNLIIKEAPKIAIEAYSGNGEIVVKNSIIKKAGTKGFYIQKGRDIIISGCKVYDNEEEGIDLRSNVDGEIVGNNIYENGESGLEFLVSDSKLNIKNNIFNNNGSSGIAAQYYEEFDEEGEITVSGNTFSKNSKYGLDCASPQGGQIKVDYWSESIDLKDNKFSVNKKGTINKSCNIKQTVLVPEVLKEQQNENRQEEIVANEKEKELQELLEKQNREKTIKDNNYSLNKLVESKKELKEQVSAETQKIEKRSGLVTFLIGPNYKAIENIKTVAGGFGEHLSQFDDLDRELIEDSNHQIAETERDDILVFVEKVNALIVEKDSKFSLFGWVFKIF